MTRVVTQYEVSRRSCMAAATEQVVAAMEEFVWIQGELTTHEWIQVLHGISGRIIAQGLIHDWNQPLFPVNKGVGLAGKKGK